MASILNECDGCACVSHERFTWPCQDCTRSGYSGRSIDHYIRAPMTIKDFSNSVSSPRHYQLFDGEKEVIDLIRDRLTPEEFIGFLKGNMVKYNMRADDKNGVEDYRKLKKYNEYLLEELTK